LVSTSPEKTKHPSSDIVAPKMAERAVGGVLLKEIGPNTSDLVPFALIGHLLQLMSPRQADG